MNDITDYPVLAYVVKLIKNTITDIKTEYIAPASVELKDGNDTVYLQQRSDENGNPSTIFIKDPKDIIFSEDLLPSLKNLQEGAEGKTAQALLNARVIINELDVETHLIFHAVKDHFDEISNSYEFSMAIEKQADKIKSKFKFGSHAFELTVANHAQLISVTADFPSSFDESIKKTIENDAAKVQQAVQKIFR